jgi:hypothetical protein
MKYLLSIALLLSLNLIPSIASAESYRHSPSAAFAGYVIAFAIFAIILAAIKYLFTAAITAMTKVKYPDAIKYIQDSSLPIEYQKLAIQHLSSASEAIIELEKSLTEANMPEESLKANKALADVLRGARNLM